MENPPRINAIIPKSIMDTEVVFVIFSPANNPVIPIKTIRIPII